MPHPVQLSTREGRKLDRIYQHPMAHNRELRDVTALFKTIGDAAPQHNGQVRLSVGEETLTLERPHSNHMTTDEVILIRTFLDGTGRAPDAADTVKQEASATSETVIVIDDAGAHTHHLGSDDEPRHLARYVDSKDHDRDRVETVPNEQQFFASVADAVDGADRIVVISHGIGQINVGDHLLAWLGSHRKEVRDRIARDLVADLPHTTTPELLDLAVSALAQPNSDATLKGAS